MTLGQVRQRGQGPADRAVARYGDAGGEKVHHRVDHQQAGVGRLHLRLQDVNVVGEDQSLAHVVGPAVQDEDAGRGGHPGRAGVGRWCRGRRPRR